MTGNELRDIRSRLGLTQEEFGERLGVTLTTVWRWEHEQRQIVESIARLVHYVAKEGKPKKKRKARA